MTGEVFPAVEKYPVVKFAAGPVKTNSSMEEEVIAMNGTVSIEAPGKAVMSSVMPVFVGSPSVIVMDADKRARVFGADSVLSLRQRQQSAVSTKGATVGDQGTGLSTAKKRLASGDTPRRKPDKG